MGNPADFYVEIYGRGMGGETPAVPVPVEDLERLARETLPERAANYVFAGAGTEDTMRANREAFDRWRIVPRMLRDATTRDLSTTVLGTTMPAPVLTAPVGVQSIVHPDGELATARAAAALGLSMILPDRVVVHDGRGGRGRGDGSRWFQLYWPNEDEVCIACSVGLRLPASPRSSSRSTPGSPWRPTT